MHLSCLMTVGFLETQLGFIADRCSQQKDDELIDRTYIFCNNIAKYTYSICALVVLIILGGKGKKLFA